MEALSSSNFRNYAACFRVSSIMLDKCHYYLSFMMNIISIGFLAKLDFKFLIKNNFCDIIINDTKIMHGQLKHGIYLLSQPIGVMYISNKCSRIDNVSDSYLLGIK